MAAAILKGGGTLLNQGTLLHPACGKGSQNGTENSRGTKCGCQMSWWPSVEDKNTLKGFAMILMADPSQGSLISHGDLHAELRKPQ